MVDGLMGEMNEGLGEGSGEIPLAAGGPAARLCLDR